MRNKLITVFVMIWLAVFHYESCRAAFLDPLFHQKLPKVKFLFPPAGWIMFYAVGDNYGYTEVYGIKDGRTQLIDPHDILQVRPIGYDNIHRNALVLVLDERMRVPFCGFLKHKFPYFDGFWVMYANYPSVTKEPLRKEQGLVYECR